MNQSTTNQPEKKYIWRSVQGVVLYLVGICLFILLMLLVIFAVVAQTLMGNEGPVSNGEGLGAYFSGFLGTSALIVGGVLLALLIGDIILILCFHCRRPEYQPSPKSPSLSLHR